MQAKLPDLYALSPDQIQQLIDDLCLVVTDNAKIFFAIDPHELNDFCFPIDPSGQNRKPNIKRIADDQAALFEVFYRQRLLLLSEYSDETRDKVTFYERTTEELRDKSEMVDRLIEEGKLVSGDIPDDQEAVQAEFLRANFSVILAIAMGIHSLGVARLKQVYRRLINSNPLKEATAREVPTVREILAGYTRTPYWNLILKQLSRPLWDSPEGDEYPPSHSHEVDANAIDRLIYLNTAFEQAWLDDKLDGRYLFVYLSSANRTTRVFTRDSTHFFLPRINGRPYNFWRTRRQIFAYVVHKNRDGKHAESARSLDAVRDVLEEVRKFKHLVSSDECHDCILKTGVVPKLSVDSYQCRWRDFCAKVKALDDEIQKARREVHNLGLINTLHDYDTLRRSQPEGKSQKQYLEFFQACFDSPLMQNARRKMDRLQQWIFVKSEFTNSFTHALGIGEPGFDQSALRSPDDLVTGSGQYLPTKPRLWTEDYLPILKCILGFYRDPNKFDDVENAYKRFVELDSETRETNFEHELIRSLLYLALPRHRSVSPSETDSDSISGDEKAYKHLEAITTGDKLLDRDDWERVPETVKQEFRYVGCWAARRSGRFRIAVELAKRGIQHDPLDPRFFHGLCLSIYSWLSKGREADTPSLETAIESTQSAIELYRAAARDGEYNDVIAANYNNLAYFLAWSIEFKQQDPFVDRMQLDVESQKAISEARNALDELEKLIPKGEWESTKHPEFFHTEAYLEYKEFTVAIVSGRPDIAKSKLQSAKRNIDTSLKLLEEGPAHEEYRQLRIQIENGLELLGN